MSRTGMSQQQSIVNHLSFLFMLSKQCWALFGLDICRGQRGLPVEDREGSATVNSGSSVLPLSCRGEQWTSYVRRLPVLAAIGGFSPLLVPTDGAANAQLDGECLSPSCVYVLFFLTG